MKMKNLFKSLFKKADDPYKVTDKDIIDFLQYSSTAMVDLDMHCDVLIKEYDLSGPWDISLKDLIVSYIISQRLGVPVL